MAHQVIVSNTTPLLAFAWMELLDLLPALFGVIHIPRAVHDELHTNPEKVGSSQLAAAAWLRVTVVQNTLAVNMLTNGLDVGESEAIVLAHELGAHLLLLDERRARRRATQSGLAIVGTLGILIEARQRGLLGTVRPYLDQLDELPFRMSESLRMQVLRRVGEWQDWLTISIRLFPKRPTDAFVAHTRKEKPPIT